ncbi:MAG TPA: efflux RND transporter periplasmic adaptor subunit [Candidatus Angelobacter sp.]|nr:efflux RND transporter periplasmic adaptor subunit [Candidatus Angelobacter sp.]
MLQQAISLSFSNATEIALTPAPLPTAMPTPMVPSRRPRRSETLAILTVVIIAAVVTAVYKRLHGKPGLGDEALQTVVEQADFIRSVRVHGVVEAVESRAIAAPRLSGQGLNTLIITKLVKNGSTVHRGDVLVEFDRENQLRNVLDKDSEYRGLLAQIKKKEAEQAAIRAADETELKKAEDAERAAELEVKKNEVVSHIDAEKNLLNLEQTRATFQQLRETFDLKRQAARSELKILKIQSDRALTTMRWAQGNKEKMLIRSTMDGVAVINSMWKGGSMSDVREGDEVRAGFPFMQVVNPARMQVRSRVNQADIPELRAGQNVHVRLDAYPELFFTGKVENIAAVAQSSAFSGRARILTVLLSINGTDAKLLPDLSAAVDVELDRRSSVLVAARDTILNENGHSYVWVKNRFSYEKREVKLGPANDVEQVIISGVEKGAVLRRHPSA